MANNRIDNLIASGRWEIEPIFGLTVLAKYYSELDFVSDGGSRSDLKLSERRFESSPRIVGRNREAGVRVDLSDSTLPAGSIAHLQLSGVMQLDDTWCTDGVRTLIESIRTADANPRISGILLEVDSGGGQSESGTELQNAIQDVVDRGQTRFGVYTQMLASAALRGTLPAEFVIASGRGSLVGSVGTYTSVSLKKLQEYREDIVDIYARQATMKNKNIRALVNEGDFGPLEDFVTESAQVFIDEVFEYRNIEGTPEQMLEVESGKLFLAQEALDRGLISGIGTFADAVRAISLTGPTGSKDPAGLPGPSRIQSNQFTGKTPAVRDFNNQYQFDMKSLLSFVSAIIPTLNAKLGLEISEDASASDVQAAIENATSVAEVRDQLETSNAEALQGLSEQIQQLRDEMSGLQENVETLTTANATLTEANTTLTKEIADMKGRSTNTDADGVSGAANNAAPAIETFKTTQSFGQSFTPSNGSKYAKK